MYVCMSVCLSVGGHNGCESDIQRRWNAYSWTRRRDRWLFICCSFYTVLITSYTQAKPACFHLVVHTWSYALHAIVTVILIVQCLSFCLSHSDVLSEWLTSKLFGYLVALIILVFTALCSAGDKIKGGIRVE